MNFKNNEFYSIDPKKGVKIQFNFDDPITSQEPITIPQFVKNVVNQFKNHAALKQKNLSTKKWETTTYLQYQKKIDQIAKAFIKLGLERYGVVAILAGNSVEWFVSDMAAIHAGGISTGIYTTNSAQAVEYILQNSKAQIIVVDDQEQLDKILQIRHNLPFLKAIVQIFSDITSSLGNEDGFWKWTELEEMDTSDVNQKYQKILSSLAPNECCSIVYTSGTTGNPKGAMLSHDNLIMFGEIHTNYFLSNGMFRLGQEVSVSFLPLSHIAAKATEMFMGFRLGMTFYFADKNAFRGTLVNTMKEVRPTYIPAVPRVYEKIQEKIMETSAKSGLVKRNIAKWATSTSLNYHQNIIAGKSNSSFQFKLASTTVLSKVKKAIGFDRIRVLGVGAAPMNVDTKEFYLSLDLPITEVYGLTETTVRAHDPYINSVGKVLGGLKVKISNPDENGHGEICVTGRTVFMGYLGELEKTLEVFDENCWFRTGDLGYMTDDGFLFITGRIKEIVITSGGENIPPVHIENLVKAQCSAISNAFLVGDKRKFLTMLIALKTEMDKDGKPLDELATESLQLMENCGLKYTKLSEVLDGPDPVITKAINDAIQRANLKAISHAQKVQKFAFLPHDFSLVTGELGPTLKVKRHFVTEKYKKLIDELYH